MCVTSFTHASRTWFSGKGQERSTFRQKIKVDRRVGDTFLGVVEKAIWFHSHSPDVRPWIKLGVWSELEGIKRDMFSIWFFILDTLCLWRLFSSLSLMRSFPILINLLTNWSYGIKWLLWFLRRGHQQRSESTTLIWQALLTSSSGKRVPVWSASEGHGRTRRDWILEWK